MVAFEHFNIINSMSVEYMHCVLLGMQKHILELFLNTKNSGKPFYIAPKHRQILNKRILGLQPPAYIVRKPRSLDDRSNFKASEFRFFLLYYLPVCLPGLVGNVYVQHVRRLSAAVYILLKRTIPKVEVNDAEKMLIRFVRDHQTLFGKQSMVMNVHLLNHLAESVRQLGPLWCHSAFAFERNNGVLLKKANGTTDVLLQISSKYALSKSILKKIEPKSNNILLGKSQQIKEQSLLVLNMESQEKLNWSNVALSVYMRIELDKTTYTSLIYTRPKRSIDYFIGLKNNVIGMAKFYVEHNNQICVVMEEFEVDDSLNHISKVQSKNRNIMALVADIQVKYIYMKIGPNQYVCSAPNPYEVE